MISGGDVLLFSGSNGGSGGVRQGELDDAFERDGLGEGKTAKYKK